MTDAADQDYAVRIVTSKPPAEVFEALTTLESLSGWWTPASGSAAAGGEITFTFGPNAKAVMHVDVAEPGVSVRWTTLECIVEDWVGTSQEFELQALPGGGTAVTFRHVGLTPKLECWEDCQSGWDHFLPTSLRAFLETGAGHPNGSPADLARRADLSVRLAAGA